MKISSKSFIEARLSWILASLAAGLTCAISLSNHFLGFSQMTFVQRLAALSPLTILIGAVFFLSIWRLIFQRSGKEWFVWVLGALAGGAILLLAFPCPVPLPPQWHTLEVIATGQKNPAASSSSVWVMDLGVGREQITRPESLQFNGSWETGKDLLFTRADQQASFSYRFKHEDGLACHIRLKTGPTYGRVIWRLDGVETHIDLYEPRPGIARHDFLVPYTRYEWLVIFYTADWLSISLLLLVLIGLSVYSRVGYFLKQHWFGLGFALITAVALLRLITVFKAALMQPLFPDASGYIIIARAMQTPYDTWIREPLWIWLIRLAAALGDGFFTAEAGVRFLGALFFLASAFLLLLLVRDVFHDRMMALVVYALYSWNGFLVELAVDGLRDNAALLAVTGMLYFIFASPPRIKPSGRLLGLTIFYLLSTGTYLSSLAPYTLMLLFGFWRNRLRAVWLIVPILAVVLVLGPYLVYCSQVFDDPFFATNVHAIYWRNVEFRDVGCVGCPTAEEWAKGSYGGSHVTSLGYLLEYHTPQQLVTGLVSGFFSLYFQPGLRLNNLIGADSSLWFPIFVVGLVVFLLRYRSERWILFAAPLVTNFLAYVNFASDRLFASNAPVITLVAGMGFVFIARLVVWMITRIGRSRSFVHPIDGLTGFPQGSVNP